MSCDAAAAAGFLMFAALTGPAPGGSAHLQPAVAEAPPPVADMPLFKDIVARAGKLKAEIEKARGGLTGAAATQPVPSVFDEEVGQLSALDQQGSDWIRLNRTGDDLKCILHGISQDLPTKLAAAKAASTPHDEDLALRDLFFLLRDNVEVITAPPQPAA